MASHAPRQLGRHDEAQTAAELAVQLDPQHPRWHQRVAHALLAAGRRPKDAVRAAQTAVRLAPDQAPCHVTYGSAAAAAGLRGTARRSFHTALRLDPVNVAARHELARLSLGTRNPFAAGELAAAAAGFAICTERQWWSDALRPPGRVRPLARFSQAPRCGTSQPIRLIFRRRCGV